MARGEGRGGGRHGQRPRASWPHAKRPLKPSNAKVNDREREESMGVSPRGRNGSEMARGRRSTAVPISVDGGASPSDGGGLRSVSEGKIGAESERETRGGLASLKKRPGRGEGDPTTRDVGAGGGCG